MERREFLSQVGAGLGGIALASLLSRDSQLFAASMPGEATDPPPHHAPKARRAIQIFLSGGLSQVDSFDYKPALEKYHGKPLPGGEEPEVFFGKVGLLHQSHWQFSPRGQCGHRVSELFPHLAECVDQMTFIHSMVSGNANHAPAIFEANSGFRLMGFPAMGSWLSYGLGAETDNLPTFVVIPDPRGLSTGGASNWASTFLPARHQGVAFGSNENVIPDLQSQHEIDDQRRFARYSFLNDMNREHLSKHAGSDPLIARIHAYEMAARMQVAIPEVVDLASESAATKKLFGFDDPGCVDFGRNCLLARRLLERGVRFVQLWSGDGQKWDSHSDVPKDHAAEAKRIDRPIAGLLRDLNDRGMLDDTLVIFNTEFGRTPFAQSESGTIGKGRDHNPHAYTIWLAGAGLKPGFAYGATDDLGHCVTESPVSVHDFHATLLYLFGIDHERLTYYHNGIQRRLTNVHGNVVHELIA